MAIIGAHVSAAGGISKAVDRAVEIGFSCIQIHPTAPQSWASPNVSDEEIQLFKYKFDNSNLKSVFFHNIYLINLAATDQENLSKAINISKKYLTLADQIGAIGTITHPGSHKGLGLENFIEQISSSLREIVDQPGESLYILENTAGAGGTIGKTLEELEIILNKLPADTLKRIGICLDTCHSFASGIPIHTEEGLNYFLEDFKSRFGMKRLSCIHLNDSKFDLGSNKDRHENLGLGFIGLENLGRIIRHPLLQNTPFIMEVPGLKNKGPDLENLLVAQKLATSF